MREEEGGRPYVAWRTPMRPSVRGPPNRTTRERDRPLGRSAVGATRSDRRARSASDPADVPAAAWNGTGRMAQMPSDSSNGTDGSDGATSDRAVIMRPRCPRENLTV